MLYLNSVSDFLSFDTHIDILSMNFRFDSPCGGICVNILGGLPLGAQNACHELPKWLVQQKMASEILKRCPMLPGYELFFNQWK